MSVYRRIGQILLERGLITPGQLEQALEARSQTHLRFGEVIVSLGFAREEVVTSCLAEQYDLPLAELDSIQPSPEALRQVPPAFALAKLLLPVSMDETTLLAVIADPADVEATDRVLRSIHRRLSLMLAPPTRLAHAIRMAYATPSKRYAATEGTAKRSSSRRPRIDAQEDRAALLDLLMTSPGHTSASDLAYGDRR